MLDTSLFFTVQSKKHQIVYALIRAIELGRDEVFFDRTDFDKWLYWRWNEFNILELAKLYKEFVKRPISLTSIYKMLQDFCELRKSKKRYSSLWKETKTEKYISTEFFDSPLGVVYMLAKQLSNLTPEKLFERWKELEVNDFVGEIRITNRMAKRISELCEFKFFGNINDGYQICRMVCLALQEN